MHLLWNMSFKLIIDISILYRAYETTVYIVMYPICEDFVFHSLTKTITLWLFCSNASFYLHSEVADIVYKTLLNAFVQVEICYPRV